MPHQDKNTIFLDSHLRYLSKTTWAGPVSDQGFTIIELVFTVLIIGILAAAALPRFSHIQEQAMLAAHQGFAGQLKSGVAIAHTAWIAAGTPTAGIIRVTVDGANPRLNRYGWRDYSGDYTPTAFDCVSNVTLLIDNFEVVTSANTCTQSMCYIATVGSGASGNSKCIYTLNGSPARIITYDSYNGNIDVF